MLPVINESNYSAVVRASTTKEIQTSITTNSMRGNDVTKSISETLTAEMENIYVPATPLHSLSRISDKNITKNQRIM